MCRLLAIIEPRNPELVKTTLAQFGELAHSGVVPAGASAGHTDGWGFAVYNPDSSLLVKKDPSSAFENPAYRAFCDVIGLVNPVLVLGHLRKASRGSVALENTHPYSFGQYSFCHNGTIMDYESLALTEPYSLYQKGQSDSERVFLWLLEIIEQRKDFLKGFFEGIKHIRQMRYTAANILMSDGNFLIALREVNEQNEDVKNKNLCDAYYTLFQGKNTTGETVLISSQSLAVPDITWEEIPNHTACVVSLATGESHLVEIPNTI